MAGQVLKDLAAEQRIRELEAENAALKKQSERAVSIKIAKQGGVSVYGLQQYPVTLYASQWERLLEQKDQILEFIRVNKASLTKK